MHGYRCTSTDISVKTTLVSQLTHERYAETFLPLLLSLSLYMIRVEEVQLVYVLTPLFGVN